MRRRFAIVMAIALGAGPSSAAHEGGVDAKGIVVEVASERITVEAEGKKQSFAITRDTKVVRDGKPAAASQLAPGDRAVVHGRERGGKLEATSIRAAAAKR